MRHTLRQKGETTDISERLTLPKHIEIQNDPEQEAKFFADAWKRAKTARKKDFVIRGLMDNGGTWDVITRSCVYYPAFEGYTKQRFQGLWR